MAAATITAQLMRLGLRGRTAAPLAMQQARHASRGRWFGRGTAEGIQLCSTVPAAILTRNTSGLQHRIDALLQAEPVHRQADAHTQQGKATDTNQLLVSELLGARGLQAETAGPVDIELVWKYNASKVGAMQRSLSSRPLCTTKELAAAAAAAAHLKEHTAVVQAADAAHDQVGIQASSVLKKRRRKMNKHKYRKWRKKMRNILRKRN